MMNLKCNRRNLAVVVLAAVALYFLLNGVAKKQQEKYLSPTPLTVSGSGGMPSDFFKLPDELDCAPSSAEKGAYYTKDLTPGGICGGQNFVNGMMGGYKIEGGIGGSLMDK